MSIHNRSWRSLPVFLIIGILAIVSAQGCGIRRAPVQITKASVQQSALDAFLAGDQVVRLPAQGTLFIANDFHGNEADFELFLSSTRFVERVNADEPVYLVLNGDLIDAKPSETTKPGGDHRIVLKLLELQRELEKGGKAGRLVLLLGNHEYQALELYDLLQQKMSEGKTREEVINELYQSKKGSIYRQFNYIERITAETAAFLHQFKSMVITDSGIVIAHGSFPRPDSKSFVEDLLWERKGKGSDFLPRVRGNLLINGHTPFHSIVELGGTYDAEKHIAFVDLQRVVLAPSYGGDGAGAYLQLDLGTDYRGVNDLRIGQEIRSFGK
jgi:hypothetical protein